MQDAMRQISRYFDGEYANYTEDLDLIKAYARRTGGPLLELGCGTGRLLLPLARAGYHVTGVDISPEMLEIARAKAQATRAGEQITLIEGDYASAPLPGPYRFAFIVMNTFMHLLNQAEQLRALRHWHVHLTPGALLLIDVINPDVAQLANLAGQIEHDKSWVDRETGHTIMKQIMREVDLAEQIMHVTMIYDEIAPGGQMRRSLVPFDLRYMWRFEAELLLDKAGFALQGIYGDWEMSPFDGMGERMILVAQRTE